MNNEIDNLMKKAAKNKNFECRANGAPEHEINSLEGLIGALLPKDYKYFLSNYGFALWFGGTIPGLIENDDAYDEEDDVRETNAYYIAFYNDPEYQLVPENGLVINSYDGGGYYFLFSKESDRAGEVGLFLTETFGQEVSSFASFTDYLSYIVTGIPEPVLVQVDYDKINNIINK